MSTIGISIFENETDKSLQYQSPTANLWSENNESKKRAEKNGYLKKLIEDVKSGLSDEEIIIQRINYLKSNEYKKSRIEETRENDKIIGTGIELGENNVVIFKDGFIDENSIIAHQSGKIDWSDGYIMDDNSIYYEILGYVRNNIDRISEKDGVSAKEVCSLVRSYFKLEKDSPYYNTCKYLENWYKNNDVFELQEKNSDLFVRYTLPEIINSYNASDYNGSIEEYTKLYTEHYYDYAYGLKDDEKDNFSKINFDENKLFSPTKISDIRHTGAAACTEYSMLLQNSLSFLGYDVYMVGGAVNSGGHNYNVICDKAGDYRIIDIAQLVYGKRMEGIEKPQELTKFGEIKIENGRGKKLIYSSEFTVEQLFEIDSSGDSKNIEDSSLDMKIEQESI